MKRRILAIVMMGLACASAPVYRPTPDAPRTAVVLHVPPERKQDALEQLELTRARLGEHGIGVALVDVRRLGHIAVLDYPARRALLDDDDRNYVHVYYVDYIPGEGENSLRGIEWQQHGRVGIGISLDAQPTTLAHEIGHALGLDHVPDDPTNVMCVCQRELTAGYTSEQSRIMLGH